MMKILVLGANGMIGSAMLRVLAQNDGWQVVGSVRNGLTETEVSVQNSSAQLIVSGDLSNLDQLARLFFEVKPDVVVNCVGLTKHLPQGNDPIPSITMNALLPHRLLLLCGIAKARLIHVSTDCVFSGTKGMYLESDHPDATDVYGKTKHLGEIVGPGAVTLRTSTIGHEVDSRLGLLEWFLAQSECKGFKRAIFSGLPTVEFARVVRDYVIPNSDLTGLYHVGATPINKDTLLRLIAQVYNQSIEIEPDEMFVIDRSLSVEKLTGATGYRAPSWPTLIAQMYEDWNESRNLYV